MMMCRVLLLIIAVGFCHAQRSTFSDQDGFVFPGEAERPSKFPLNPTGSTPSFTSPTQRPSQRTTSAPVSSTPAGTPTTTASARYTQCFAQCPATSEYNPICGTDNVVYTNPGRLNCAVSCGNRVQMKNVGQCQAAARG